MNTITINLVSKDGSVDVEASVAAATAAIQAYKAERETEESTILNALNSVFDQHKGTRMNVPFVISQALTHLNVAAQPGNYSTLQARVHSFLTANSQGKINKETKTVERPNSLFVIPRGKNASGVARRADMTPAAAVAAAEATDSE